MHKVIFNNELFFSQHGQLLSDVLLSHGETLEHPCGGNGICRKCSVEINGRNELSCRYRVTSDIVVNSNKADRPPYKCEDDKIVLAENSCLVLDIGTTTLALALVSPGENKVHCVKTALNPQCAFGADVISRIGYCGVNGVKKLQIPLIDELNRMIAGLDIDRTLPLTVAGNTVMLHLFFGDDCTALGQAPYTPAFLGERKATGDELGIMGVSTVASLPCISAFVGSDIVSGLNYVDCGKNEKYNLLIDLGTNAEIVLFSQRDFLCTSAAAGPCFEGASISCGMGATDGAVYAFDGGNIKTINNAVPRGICGTGLIDIVAFLLQRGIVDRGGFMECEEYEIANGLYVTQDDIRQYQLAKSSVYSAVMTLIDIKGINPADIDTVYISGGFSAEINIRSAVDTGLLPKEFSHKCQSLNNSSLLGAVKYVAEQNNISEIIRKAEYTDLSLNKKFADLFIKNMMFR